MNSKGNYIKIKIYINANLKFLLFSSLLVVAVLSLVSSEYTDTFPSMMFVAQNIS